MNWQRQCEPKGYTLEHRHTEWNTTSFWASATPFPPTSIIPNTPRSTAPVHNWLENERGTPLSNDFTFVSSAWADDWLARSSEIVKKYHPDII